MPLPYNPADAATAWPEADYPATLIKVEDAISKTSGQPMQVWTFEVFDDANDRKQTIKDYVTAKAAFKLRDLAKALGQSDAFKAGTFQADENVGCNVLASLVIEQQDGYDDKNKIGRVLPKTNGATAAPTAHQKSALAAAKAGTAKVSPPPKALQESAAGAGVANDDLPF
jgi:hypothetical protein